jgi:ubiquinone/menaquinone biosynthesis C-methylase UbiE
MPKPVINKDFKKPKSKVTYNSEKPKKPLVSTGESKKEYSNKQRAFGDKDYKPKVYGNKTSRSSKKPFNSETDSKQSRKALGNQETSWGSVANWYQKMVEDKDSYQNKVILPKLLRLLDIKKGETILDLGCGVGYFCEQYHINNAKVIGVDIGVELIEVAQKSTNSEIIYHVNTAEKLPFLANSSIDKITIVLALQNIKWADKVITEASRVLKKNGKLFVVLNHPYFRIPKYSSWEWSPKDWVQFRKIEKYLLPFESEIDMKPGEKDKSKKQVTMSFHRPLEFYIQSGMKQGLVLENMEEWISHRPSDQGNKTKALEISRNEIPLFMCLVWKKV